MTSIGDVIYVHDSLLGTSKNVMRWCVVVATTGAIVRVAPRSASSPGAIFTPAGLLPEFSKDGCFSRWTVAVDSMQADAARNIGQLPEPARSDVLRLVSRRRQPRSQP